MFNSDIEQEVQHVAVLDDVVLAFGAHLAGFLGALFALVLDEVVKDDGLGVPAMTLPSLWAGTSTRKRASGG